MPTLPPQFANLTAWIIFTKCVRQCRLSSLGARDKVLLGRRLPQTLHVCDQRFGLYFGDALRLK